MKIYEKINSYACDFLNSPAKILLSLFVLGALISIMMLFVPVFYRDSVFYIAGARALQLGNWDMAFDLTITPGVPVLGGLLMYLGLDEMQGVTLASSLFGIAMIMPCYGVLSFYMSKKEAAWGTALFFLIPQNVEASFAPLMDSARWFFFFLSWYLILKFLQGRRFRELFFLGCSYAGFSLVRSEGIVFTALFSLYFFLELLQTSGWKFEFKPLCRNLGFTLFPLLVALVFLLPRLVQCWICTGYPSLDMRQTWAVRGILNNIIPQADHAGLMSYGSVTDFNGSWISDAAFHRRFWNNILTGCFIPYLLIACFGAYQIIRRKLWSRMHTLFLVFLVINAFVYFIMRSNAGRYFYLHAFFIMPFTLYGLKEIVEYFKKLPFSQYVLLPAAMVLLAVFLTRGIGNFRFSNMMRYPVLGKFMQEYSRQKPTRSGLNQPIYLVIGKNYGWGYQCRGNEIFYSGSKHLSQQYTLREVLESGVPATYCLYAVERLPEQVVLKPDYVIVDHGEDRSDILKCRDLLQEIPQRQFPEVQLYQVIGQVAVHE